jgi:hypothetical protein
MKDKDFKGAGSTSSVRKTAKDKEGGSHDKSEADSQRSRSRTPQGSGHHDDVK